MHKVAELGGLSVPVKPARNVLILVADDLGVDMLASYGEGTDPPVTPNLDGLAAEGILFRNAWSNPSCSPTRSQLVTGRHAFRTGIGHWVSAFSPTLSLAEVTLPEMLDLGGSGYSHAAIGKWHLDNPNSGFLTPNLNGWSHFEGTLLSFGASGSTYYSWLKTTNGVVTTSTEYATTSEVDSALGWIQGASEPWLCYLPFHTPHRPLHVPPRGTYAEDLTGLDPDITPRPFCKAMIENMDFEIGRLLAGVNDPACCQLGTLVVFLGDNGTIGEAVVPPFSAGQAKNTLYEGGVNVPLIFSGAGVVGPGRECGALVQVSDLFATVADVAGVDTHQVMPGIALDSLSLKPYLEQVGLASERQYVFAEIIQPTGTSGVAPGQASRAARGVRYKLIQNMSGTEELYDLFTDPFERTNLMAGSLTSQQQAAHDALAAFIVGTLSS